MGPVVDRAARVGFPQRLVVVWLVVAVGMGAFLALARAAAGPLDDPDPARQRPGFVDGHDLPAPAPVVTDEVPRSGRRAVVFFVRPAELQALCEALTGFEPPAETDVAVVLVGEGGRCPQGIPIVPDEEGELVAGYGLPVPRDGGPPVGYAVVDGVGQVRYRTLDPEVASLLPEVTTMLKAVP